MHKDTTILATYFTNSFLQQPLVVLAAATLAGLTAMFASLQAGGGGIVSTVALVGGIGLVLGFGAGKATFTIHPAGIGQQVVSFLPLPGKPQGITRFFAWQQIMAYKCDEDMNRSGQPYEYIKLFLSVAPGEVWITNQKDKEAFAQFRTVFLAQVALAREAAAAEAATPQATPGTSASRALQASATPILREKKSFYTTRFAKGLTVVFIILTCLLLWVGLQGTLQQYQLDKILFIMLPGTVYMSYRVFFFPKHTPDT